MVNTVCKFINSKGSLFKRVSFGLACGGEDRAKGKLETTSLHRLVVNVFQKDGTVEKRLEGNIPIKDIESLLELSKVALQDKMVYHQELEFPLLDAESNWKPKLSTVDDKGNPLVYNIDIKYNGKNSLPIVFTLSNAYSPVIKRADGRINTNLSQSYGKESLTFYLSVKDWHDELAHAKKFYDLYLNRLSQTGYYDEDFGIKV